MKRIRFEFTGHPRDVILNRERTVFGRSEDVDVTLVTDTMSRNHFEVFKRDGSWFVKDLGSSNGSRLDGDRLGSEERKLTAGQVIRAGGIEFTFDPPRDDGRAPKAKLELLNDDDSVASSIDVHLSATLGRRDDNDLVVEEVQVSSYHCGIEYRAGTFVVRDFDSTNGTLVKGQKIKDFHLSDGDIFFLGLGMRVRLKLAGAAAAVRTAEAISDAEANRPVSSAVQEPIPSAMPLASSFAAILICAAIGVGLAVGLPKLAEDSDAKKPGDAGGAAAANPSPSPALGFEVDNLAQHWSVEAAGEAGVGMAMDTGSAKAGNRCMVLRPRPAAGTAATRFRVTSIEAQPLDLSQAATMAIWVRGKVDAATLLRVWALDDASGARMIGQTDFRRVSLGNWVKLDVPIASPRPIRDARLGLEFDGVIDSLWLDAISISATENPPAPPMLQVASGIVETRIGNGPELVATGGSGRGPVSFHGAFKSKEGLVTDGPWVFAPRLGRPDTESLRAALSSTNWTLATGTIPALSCRVNLSKVEHPKDGVLAEWQPSKGQDFILRVAANSRSLVLYDYVNNPIPVTNPLPEPVGTVAGFSVANLHFRMLAPNVAQATVTKSPDGYEILLSFPGLRDGDPVRVEMHSAPVMEYWRNHALLKEIDRLAPPGVGIEATRKVLGTQALERAKYLASLNPNLFGDLVAEGLTRRDALQARADEIWKGANDAANSARESSRTSEVRSADQALSALRYVGRFLEEFFGDPRIGEAQALLEEMNALRNRMMGAGGVVASNELDDLPIRSRAPTVPSDHAQLAAAQAFASSLMAEARAAHDAGSWLRAWVLAENIAFNFGYTDAARDARTLVATITTAWENEAERSAFVTPLLAEARNAKETGDRAAVRRACEAILAKYPACPESLEVRALLVESTK